jgi:hypothetical protein
MRHVRACPHKGRDLTSLWLALPVSSFWEWAKVEGVEHVEIGNVSLFRKEAIMAKRRSG